jgi:hypothetical protein
MSAKLFFVGSISSPIRKAAPRVESGFFQKREPVVIA